jgi:hypothetical protein
MTSKFLSKGTYQIAAICSDGIVIGTDTRSYIPDKHGKIRAYFDPVQKIFPLKGFAISASGTGLINGKYLNSYFKEFQEAHPIEPLLEDNIQSFLSFINTKDKYVYETILNNKIIFARYEKGVPRLCGTFKGNILLDPVERFVSEDDLSDFVYDGALSCEETAKKIQSSIINYVDKYQKEQEINKHISALRISPQNEFSWILNSPDKKEWETFDDFIKSHKDGGIKFYFTSEENKRKILDQLGKY